LAGRPKAGIADTAEKPGGKLRKRPKKVKTTGGHQASVWSLKKGTQNVYVEGRLQCKQITCEKKNTGYQQPTQRPESALDNTTILKKGRDKERWFW